MRCKACNRIMTPAEMVWRPERGEHEDMCKSCRVSLVVEDEMGWVNSYEDDHAEEFEEDEVEYDENLPTEE